MGKVSSQLYALSQGYGPQSPPNPPRTGGVPHTGCLELRLQRGWSQHTTSTDLAPPSPTYIRSSPSLGQLTPQALKYPLTSALPSRPLTQAACQSESSKARSHGINMDMHTYSQAAWQSGSWKARLHRYVYIYPQTKTGAGLVVRVLEGPFGVRILEYTLVVRVCEGAFAARR